MGFFSNAAEILRGFGDGDAGNIIESVTSNNRSNRPFSNDLNALIYRGGMMTREIASTVSAVHRAITLVSGSGSDAIVDTLRVTDAKTRKSVSTRETEYVVDMLKDSPDGITPAHTFWEDALTDLLASGNAVFKVSRDVWRSYRSRIDLCHPLSSSGYIDGNGKVTFRITPDNDPHGITEFVSDRQVIICRWPRVGSRAVSAGSGRMRWFATPPIQSLGNAIMLSLDAEGWASKVFDRSSGAMGSDYAIMMDHLTSEQEDRFYKMLDLVASGRSPLVLGRDAKIQKLTPTPQDANLKELRLFQIDEVARTYGIPSVLLGKTDGGNVWGSSLTALETMYLRYGLRLHLNRLLEPLSFRLLPPNLRLATDDSRVFRGDADALAKLITATMKTNVHDGVLSKAELRSLIGVDGEYIDDYENPAPSGNAIGGGV